MRVKLVSINGEAVLLVPQRLLSQCGIEGEVTVRRMGETLIIRDARRIRQGWQEAIQSGPQGCTTMFSDDDDCYDFCQVCNEFDEGEWE